MAKWKKKLKKLSPVAIVKKTVTAPLKVLKKVAAVQQKIIAKSPMGKLARKGHVKKLMKLSPMGMKMRLAQKLPGGKKLVKKLPVARFSPLHNLRRPATPPMRAYAPAVLQPALPDVPSPLDLEPAAPLEPQPIYVEPAAPPELEPAPLDLEPAAPELEPVPMETFDAPADEWPAETDTGAESGEWSEDASTPWDGDMLGELSQSQPKSAFSPEALLTVAQGLQALRYQDKLAKLNTARLARGDAPIDASAAALVVPAPRIQVDVGADTKAEIGRQFRKYAVPGVIGLGVFSLAALAATSGKR